MSPLELQALVNRIRGEFIEMPGLQLTIAQAARLWSMDRQVCEAVVDALLHARFLQRTPAGTISRAD